MRRVTAAGFVIFSLAGTAALLGCAGMTGHGDDIFTYRNYPVATASAAAGVGNSVTFKGAPAALSGQGVKVGDRLRSVKVARGDLSLIDVTDGRGKVRIVSIVPSLDTKVCEQQTHYLSERNNGLDRSVELITISVDTPFAQERFAKEAKIRNVTFLSDYRGGEFGKTHGLLLEGPHMLARAVMVLDAQNIVRYLQITPELAHMPDMDAAFQAARELP
jgi:thiol peroxidase